MDNVEKREVLRLVKYSRRHTRIIIDQAMVRGRINKRELSRAGMTRKEIEAALQKLRDKLKDYRDE